MPEEHERRRFYRFARIFFKAHVLNGFVSVIIMQIIGGAAALGYQKEGHFFVGQHGHYVEVSRAVYEFSTINVAYSTITILISLVGIMLIRNFAALRIKLSLNEWALASIVPLFWLLLFLVDRFVPG